MPGSSGGTEAEDGAAAADDESGSSSGCAESGAAADSWFSRKAGGTKGWRLRGVEWRVNLGVLPAGNASVEAMRRATADGRRKYAELRRRLLVDPHFMDDEHFPHMMDNPLSLDPESVWGRYFRNDELGKIIEKDLIRLCPEHGTFLQTASCQAMLRRILLVWSLIHPQISYRQGMHELLAPLLYVLHVDVIRLSEVKRRFEDLFDDRFDSLFMQEQYVRDRVETAGNLYGEMVVSGDSIKFRASSASTEATSEGMPSDLEDHSVDLSSIIKGCDMYGAEGELGALLSARFLEHDAYCMLDALLSGQHGIVAMADYFLPANGGGKPPVIEASLALYRVLAAADSSLYTHLVDLGVEPQFFALRWLRLLFGREFVLEDLLRIWDAIFGADNSPSYEGKDSNGDGKLSQRVALIFSISVSMLLYVRPALLATSDVPSCLQRLLNFPRLENIKDLIDSAKSLQILALAAAKSHGLYLPRSSRPSDITALGKTTRSGSASPPASQRYCLRPQILVPPPVDFVRPSMSLPGSYWEERWTHSILRKTSLEPIFLSNASSVESDPLGSDASGGRGLSGPFIRERRSSREFYNEHDDGQEMSNRGGEVVSCSEVDLASGEARSGMSPRANKSDEELTGHPRINAEEGDPSSFPQDVAGFSSGDTPLVCSRGEDGQLEPSIYRESAGSSSNGGEENLEASQRIQPTHSATRDIGNENDSIRLDTGLVWGEDVGPHVFEASVGKGAMVCVTAHPGGSPDTEAASVPRGGFDDGKNVANEGAKAESLDCGASVSVEDNFKDNTTKPLGIIVASSKPKATLTQIRFRWLSWIWNFGRTSTVEKVIAPKVPKEDRITIIDKQPVSSGTNSEICGPVVSSVAPRRKKSWWRANTDVVPEEQPKGTSADCAAPVGAEYSLLGDSAKVLPGTSNEPCDIAVDALEKEEFLSEGAGTETGPCPDSTSKPEETNTPSTLQVIGQSVLDHVQVLELALAQKVSGGLGIENMMWPPGLRDKAESNNKAGLGSVGQGAAVTAIAELRKISQALQQM